ncbi:RecT-like DNA pairing protein [Mycobacterium phage MichelleMyBell]|uniref:RecT-like DNA pairing protein n=1 Tax=Mycobacterium phage MichelleMyBell TaxID=1445726 RepID=W0LPX4_9CAUD|nr:RecT-like ssDNA annealing protein [Mycobacterium phage MichelleMyBell]AHG24369.1 RecT-like DNA pairing protein [Mycobacterium phage MichelleMyBell]
MSTDVATTTDRKPTLAQLIERQKGEIARALPAHMNPDRMARIAVTVLRQTPALTRCSPESFLGALMTASQLGLEPGPLGESYFVPFGREVTFVPGYRGLIKLARNSGLLVDIWAEIVYENDEFEYTLGLHRDLKHVPAGGDRGKPVYVYAAAQLKDGGTPFVVMTVAEVEAIRKRSKAGKNGPWVTDWGPMAKKTAVKQLAKWLPLSAEFNTATVMDGTVRSDYTSDLIDVKPEYIDGEVDDNAAAEPADVPDDADPDVIDGEATEIRMASNDQLRRLAEIQKAEKYTDADWFSFLAEAAGVQATRAADLTFEEAARAIAVFDGPDQ